ncbi:Protein of unknown function [Escherichia coli]|nr:Protein of unknown function [Escherichia coli]CDU39913.1 Protein of unknown function [Escherichia coli]
MELIFIGD